MPLQAGTRLRLCRRDGAVLTAQALHVRPAGDTWLVRPEGTNSPEVAKRWHGASLPVPTASLPAPAAGEFYLFELPGATGVDQAGETCGTVQRVADKGGQPLLCLARRLGGGDGAAATGGAAAHPALRPPGTRTKSGPLPTRAPGICRLFGLFK